ncbi:hypothetical protein RYO59_001243 [Thermosynechococcaceae cyanobacterium Okahandja]
MLRPLMTFTLGVAVATLATTLPSYGQACAYLKGLSQNATSTSFFEGGKLPLILGLGAGTAAATAVGVTLWQRRAQASANTSAAALELDVVLPESEVAESSNAEDATPIA